MRLNKEKVINFLSEKELNQNWFFEEIENKFSIVEKSKSRISQKREAATEILLYYQIMLINCDVIGRSKSKIYSYFYNDAGYLKTMNIVPSSIIDGIYSINSLNDLDDNLLLKISDIVSKYEKSNVINEQNEVIQLLIDHINYPEYTRDCFLALAGIDSDLAWKYIPFVLDVALKKDRRYLLNDIFDFINENSDALERKYENLQSEISDLGMKILLYEPPMQAEYGYLDEQVFPSELNYSTTNFYDVRILNAKDEQFGTGSISIPVGKAEKFIHQDNTIKNDTENLTKKTVLSIVEATKEMNYRNMK